MRSIITAALAVLLLVAPAYAGDRAIIYPGQQPTSTQANLGPRFARLAFGTWMRDALGPTNAAGGLYANLSVVPNGGMNVLVQPTTAGQLGSLYQLAQSDAAALPAGVYSPQLSPDTTTIVLQGLLGAPSTNLGPLTAPSSGLSQYYLIEAQLQTTDTTPLSMLFIDSAGRQSSRTVNTVRRDQIAFQLVPGTAGSSPAKPSVGSGWIAIGYVLVPSGTVSISSGMISASPAFAGFVANGATIQVTGVQLLGGTSGCIQTDSSGNFSVQPCTAGLGSVVGTAPISASTVSGVATVNCPTCVTSVLTGSGLSSSGGTTPTISLGTVPIAHGGTGQTSLPTGVLSYNGSAIVAGTAVTGLTAGTGISVGTGGTPSIGLSHGDYADLTNTQTIGGSKTFSTAPAFGSALAAASGGTGLASYTVGDLVYASGSTTIAKLSDVATGNVIRSGGVGTAPAWGKLNLSTDVTGTALINNGGTGQTSLPTGVLQYNGSAIVAAPTFVDLTSSQTIAGTKTFSVAPMVGVAGTGTSYAYLFGNAVPAGTCAGQTTQVYSGTTTVQGVSGSLLGVSCVSGGNEFALDASGNAGFSGNVTAANFFNGSRRAWKTDIAALEYRDIFGMDALGVLAATDWASYRYRAGHGDPHEQKIGFIADDTPDVLSGPRHDHFDAGALATVNSLAILELRDQVTRLTQLLLIACLGAVLLCASVIALAWKPRR